MNNVNIFPIIKSFNWYYFDVELRQKFIQLTRLHRAILNISGVLGNSVGLKYLVNIFPARCGFEWIEDCLHFYGKILINKKAHWCTDWDGLPIDQTCDEFENGCMCSFDY